MEKDLIMIDISEADDEEKLKYPYFEIKDNGVGIHPSIMKEALTTFGSNNIAITKSDFNLCEHGIGLKLNALRLG
jgi:signal transduction histidine kinase